VFPTSDILDRLAWLLDEAARWGPALPVALMFAVALSEAVILPWRYWVKGAAVLVVVLFGVGSMALLRWEQQVQQRHLAANDAADRVASEISALHGLWAQWDTLSRSLPAPADGGAAAAFDTVDDARAALSAKVSRVGEQIAALQAQPVGRAVDPATAVRLADHLRQYGSYRVVVSCAPEDLEAYTYANQLMNILRAAGWDAHGPETTINVSAGPAMDVKVFVRDPSAPDVAKILLEAFGQFNIPSQPGVTAEYAIPDTATVELFVAKKP